MIGTSCSGFKVEQEEEVKLDGIGNLGLVVNSEHVFRESCPVPNGLRELCIDARNLEKDKISQMLILLPDNVEVDIHPRARFVFVHHDSESRVDVEAFTQTAEDFQNVAKSRNLKQVEA